KFIVALATRGLPIKKITTIHAADIGKYKKSTKNKFLFIIDNFLHNHVYDKTIVVSKAAQDVAINQRKLNPEKLQVLLNGIIPLKKIGKTPDYSDKIILGTACRFQPIKGLQRLLKLFALLVKSTPSDGYFKLL